MLSEDVGAMYYPVGFPLRYSAGKNLILFGDVHNNKLWSMNLGPKVCKLQLFSDLNKV